ncbi:fumarylacetoacetase [Euzebya tangerina]|uniref:fumarylacetoacetase n=1 Tax=Euzebya tangerina TaxID=591198 RepID=UPI000E3186AC|nr:fumarylacetoacetase [Euzebya tangerina]
MGVAASWVEGAEGSGFDLAHLPYGVVLVDGRPTPAVRIGDQALDLRACHEAGMLPEGAWTTVGFLDQFVAGGGDLWARTRATVTQILTAARPADLPPMAVVALRDLPPPLLPFTVADYVDFYSSIHHATNVGRIFRPDADPLLPNWRHLPVGYHGRSATVVVDGTDVVRPAGQLGLGDDGTVRVGPSERLDIELELGFVVGGTPNPAGVPLTMDEARQRLFGVVLLNDWSARDIQAWEYRPLGPFLGKSFQTSIGAWITPLAALAEAAVEPPSQDPPVAPHLRGDRRGGLDLNLWVELQPAGSPEAATVSRVNAADLYWTATQQLVHLASNGAVVRSGELFGSGTISGPDRGTEGSLLELTVGGSQPLDLAGHQRTYLEDGDTVTLRGTAPTAGGGRLTLASVTGTVRPAPVLSG